MNKYNFKEWKIQLKRVIKYNIKGSPNIAEKSSQIQNKCQQILLKKVTKYNIKEWRNTAKKGHQIQYETVSNACIQLKRVSKYKVNITLPSNFYGCMSTQKNMNELQLSLSLVWQSRQIALYWQHWVNETNRHNGKNSINRG